MKSFAENDSKDGLSCNSHQVAQELLTHFLTKKMPGEMALVSSFGAESAILLHMVSHIAPNTPVIFLDTGKLFRETLEYKKKLIDLFGLTNVHSAYPNAGLLEQYDLKKDLWQTDPDLCCQIRKVIPLQEALLPFKGWITGRKRYHSNMRSEIPAVEDVGDKVKLNPLVGFTAEDVQRYFTTHNIPHHPLVSEGFQSIGCEVCTAKPTSIDDPRSGRWVHAPQKTECGIHFADGKVVRLKGNKA